jgi:hypothetical protein
LDWGISDSPLPVIQTGGSGGIRSMFFSISALTQNLGVQQSCHLFVPTRLTRLLGLSAHYREVFRLAILDFSDADLQFIVDHLR